MGKHFELTGETLIWGGRTLHRIRATRDIVCHYVDKGDLGGWVENPDNLHDEAWVGDEAKLCDDASMWDQAFMCDNASMTGHSRMSGSSSMFDHSRMNNYSRMSDSAKLYDGAFINDHASMSGHSRMHGTSGMHGYSRMSGDAIMREFARLTGYAHLSGGARMVDQACMTGDGEATSPAHILTGTIYTSHMMNWTLHRTRYGGHVLRIGCESGTLDHHQALCDSDRWIETTEPDIIAAARPEYQAVIDFCRARVARWTD